MIKLDLTLFVHAVLRTAYDFLHLMIVTCLSSVTPLSVMRAVQHSNDTLQAAPMCMLIDLHSLSCN